MLKMIIKTCLMLLLGSASVYADDETDIRHASKLWVDTYNSNDWQALSLLFAPDAVMMPPNSAAITGRRAIAEWEATYENGFQIAFDINEIKVFGNVAYVAGRSCVYVPLEDGRRGIDIGKFLEIRERQSDGQWLITRDIFNSDISTGGDLATSCPF